jgi:hypothetical protein
MSTFSEESEEKPNAAWYHHQQCYLRHFRTVFKSELSKDTSSVTLTLLSFSLQICKMEFTPGLWIRLNEMMFNKFLAVSNL